MTTKKTFYLLMSEFYKDGTINAAVVERARIREPKNTYKKLPFAECFNDWFKSRSQAEKALARIRGN